MADDDQEFLEYMDTQPLAFGKHKGETPEDICKVDPGYIVWVGDNVKPLVVSKKLYLIASEMNDSKSVRVRTHSNHWRNQMGFEIDDDDVPF